MPRDSLRVRVDVRAVEQRQVPPGQALQEARQLGLLEVGGTIGQQGRDALLRAVDHLVAVGQRQVVVGADVEPPQQLLFPGRERSAAHRLDVDQREQAEHLQPLLGADQGRERPHHVRVLAVLAEGDPRHLEVVADEELHVVPRVGAESELVEHDVGHPDALGGVLLVGPLADVVKQQCQHEVLGRPDLGQQRPEPLPSRGPGPSSRSMPRIVSSVCSSTVYLW